MMASSWTDEDSRVAAEKIIKRAEISKITRRLKSRLSIAREKTQDLMSPGVESLDSRSSVSAASSDSRVPTPTSFAQPFVSAPPLENPFLVPTQGHTRGIPNKSHHRKSQSRGSTHSLNGTSTLKPPMTDQQPKRKRSRTASDNQLQYGELMLPKIPKESWRTHQSSPIRQPPAYQPTSVSHLNPQMLESPFPQNYNTTGPQRSSPPSTPPSAFRRRPISGSGEEGADLLLFLATSPSPARPSSRRFTSNVVPPGTPPSMIRKSLAVDPATPSQSTFDVRDYINITPSPAPAVWNGGTPLTVGTPARRRLTYDDAVVGSPLGLGNDGVR